MKTLFIMTDIHSFYDTMQETLKEAGFDIKNPNHIFVSLGDLLDRGDKPLECLAFVNSIPEGRKILIRGNHEDLLDKLIDFALPTETDFRNGTWGTYCAIRGAMDEYEEYKRFLYDYAIIGNNVFVHGWVPLKKIKVPEDKMSAAIDYVMYDFNDDGWKDPINFQVARWSNGMDEARYGYIWEDKTIFCGHYHTSWGHCKIEQKSPEVGPNADFSPYIAKGIVALDACTAYSGRMNCWKMEVSDEQFREIEP